MGTMVPIGIMAPMGIPGNPMLLMAPMAPMLLTFATVPAFPVAPAAPLMAPIAPMPPITIMPMPAALPVGAMGPIPPMAPALPIAPPALTLPPIPPVTPTLQTLPMLVVDSGVPLFPLMGMLLMAPVPPIALGFGIGTLDLLPVGAMATMGTMLLVAPAHPTPLQVSAAPMLPIALAGSEILQLPASSMPPIGMSSPEPIEPIGGIRLFTPGLVVSRCIPCVRHASPESRLLGLRLRSCPPCLFPSIAAICFWIAALACCSTCLAKSSDIGDSGHSEH